MKNKNNQFDKELHDRLSNEELPFDPLAWDMMEEKLDKKPKRFFLFWIFTYRYLLGSLSILLLATFIYWSFHYNNLVDRSHSEVVPISDITSDRINATSETSTITALSSEVLPQMSEKEVKSSPIFIDTAERISEIINKPISSVVNNVKDRKSIVNIGLRDDQIPDNFIKSSSIKVEGIQNILDKKNTAQIEKSKSIPNSLLEADESDNEYRIINSLSNINNLETALFAFDREMDFNIDIENIDRPKHQINMTFGAGMTQLDIDEPFVGGITPEAVSNQEMFVSLSYLYRMNRNWGIEIGAQAAYTSQKIAYYFQEGEFNLAASEYGIYNVNAFEGKYELFTNIHFFLPLNQRSELDFYGGFYTLNPFSQQGAWGSGGGTYSRLNEDVILIGSRVSGTSGAYNGGRIKLGMNYNFLTNKLNNVGVGIAYMHQINNVVEGTYTLIQTSEEAKVSGNLRANPSGFKVQLTYGFGLKRLQWNKSKWRKPSPKTPWYVGLRYGTKKFILGDDLSRALVNAPSNKYQSIYVGYYIKQKIAFEIGLEYSEFTFSTPLNEQFILKSQKLISVPFALRYDLVQTNRLSLYGKGVFSTDFRLNQRRNFPTFETGFLTDKNNLLLNTGLEAGVDFRIVKGVNIGLVGKYNHAFRRAAQYQYPELTSQNDIVFRDINLKNTSFSWGVELKYYFNSY